STYLHPYLQSSQPISTQKPFFSSESPLLKATVTRGRLGKVMERKICRSQLIRLAAHLTISPNLTPIPSFHYSISPPFPFAIACRTLPGTLPKLRNPCKYWLRTLANACTLKFPAHGGRKL